MPEANPLNSHATDAGLQEEREYWAEIDRLRREGQSDLSYLDYEPVPAYYFGFDTDGRCRWLYPTWHSVSVGRCTLAYDHDGEHVWELRHTTQEEWEAQEKRTFLDLRAQYAEHHSVEPGTPSLKPDAL